MRILATGKYLPDHVLTNAELEKRVDTTDEWIVTRTGIRERRIAREDETTSDMGAHAARKAMEKAGVTADEIDMIIVATVTPDAIFPSTACYLQHKLGAQRAAAFDIQAACSGFLYGLVMASQMLRNNAFRTILVVGAEKLSTIVDWNDRATCVLFGDGAGAAVVRAREDGRDGILAHDLGANGNLHDILYLMNGNYTGPDGKEPRKGPHCMKMSGPEVFKQAVTEMAKSAVKVMTEAGLTNQDIACAIPHQANIRIIDALSQRLKIPEGKTFINVQRYGNISAACIPVALCEAQSHYNLKRGDKILLVAFGGGLTWAAAVIEW